MNILSNVLVLLRLIACGLFASFLIACSQNQQTEVIRIGHTLDTKHSVHVSLAYMAERLAFYSDNQMTIKLYPNGQLGSERQMIELLQIGSLAMTKVSSASLEGFVEDVKVLGLPYVFTSKEQRWKTLEGDIGKDILASLSPAHFVGLGYMDAGSRSFYTCNSSVSSPRDIKGKKIRVMDSQNAVNLIDAFGGSGTPLSWGELYAALQQGVVDGAENNPPSYYLSRHYEVCKNYTLNEHTAIPDVVIISKHIYDSLNTEQQQWLMLAMQDAVELQKELWQQAENDALAALKEQGVNILYPDKAPFIEAVKPLHDDLAPGKVRDYLQRIKRLNQSE